MRFKQRIGDLVRALLYQPPSTTNRDWMIDGLLTCGLGLLVIAPSFLIAVSHAAEETFIPNYGDPILVYFASLLFMLPLTLRRHYPLLMTLACSLTAILQVCISGLPPVTCLVVPLITFSVARLVPDIRSRLVLVFGFLGSVIGPVRWVFQGERITAQYSVVFVLVVGVCLFSIVTPYAVGRRLMDSHTFKQAEHARQMALYASQLEQAEQRARIAEINVRQSIAQELHDIVAHSLSVMIVQAEGGKALASKRPEAATQVLDTIADTGRQALMEMRRIVSVLRTEDHAQYSPQPSLSELSNMIDRAGSRVQLQVLGTPYPVSEAVSLAVYRVIQEAVTNVFKHAGPQAQAWVTVQYTEDTVEAQIRDNGVGLSAHNDGQGNGLRGMRERIATVGGKMMTQTPAEGGFIVRISVPIKDSENNKEG